MIIIMMMMMMMILGIKKNNTAINDALMSFVVSDSDEFLGLKILLRILRICEGRTQSTDT